MSTPIRKSLLTPYRRIGLSRNTKTTSNGSFISPLKTEDIKLVNDDTPPINARISKLKSSDEKSSNLIASRQKQQHDETIKVDIEESSIPIVSTENKNKVKAKKNDLKYIKQNEEINSVIDNLKTTDTEKSNRRKQKQSSRKNNLEQVQVYNTRENIPELENEKTVGDGNSKESTNSQESNVTKESKESKAKTKRRKYVLDSDDDDDSHFSGFPSSGSSGKSSVQENSKNEDFEIKKRKRINIKDSQDNHNIENDIKTKTDFKNNLIHGKIIENDSESEENCINKPRLKPKSNKTIKRKFSLSLKKSLSDTSTLNEEERFQEHKKSDTLTSENKENTDIIEEIIKLEKTVRNKEDYLDKLKQAEIYRSLHKLDDLKTQTDIWKSGCKNALTDLLKHLNQHSTIDMNTMLVNLKIPQNMFKYDADNDCFYE